MKRSFKLDKIGLNTNFALQAKGMVIKMNDNRNDKDPFIIGDGFLIDEESGPVEEPARSRSAGSAGKKKRNRKQKGCLGLAVWITVISVISIGIALGICFAVADMMGLGREGTVELQINPGDDIPTLLKEENAISYPTLFKLYIKLKKVDSGSFRSGLFRFKRSAGYSGIIDYLKSGGAVADTVDVEIRVAASIPRIAAILEEAGVCTRDEFNEAVKSRTSYPEIPFVADIPVEIVSYRFEGYFYPDTYNFYTGDTPNAAQLAIERMLKQTEKYLTPEVIAAAKARGFDTVHEILTLASIIEAECNGYPEAMPSVSMVFQNRMTGTNETGGYLGSTPTEDYLKGTAASKNYNTNPPNGRVGLPVGPMCTVTREAIRAVAFPNEEYKGMYYYFVTDKNFQFYYNKTYSEHERTIANLKRQGLWA